MIFFSLNVTYFKNSFVFIWLLLKKLWLNYWSIITKSSMDQMTHTIIVWIVNFNLGGAAILEKKY